MARLTNIPENWVTAADVSRFFDCSERNVVRWINDGTLKPAGQVGKTYYFDYQDVREACSNFKLR
jgi:hypothetical protein